MHFPLKNLDLTDYLAAVPRQTLLRHRELSNGVRTDAEVRDADVSDDETPADDGSQANGYFLFFTYLLVFWFILIWINKIHRITSFRYGKDRTVLLQFQIILTWLNHSLSFYRWQTYEMLYLKILFQIVRLFI